MTIGLGHYLSVAAILFTIGIFPYAAVLLLQGGEPRASIAGLVVAAFAVGGLIYSVSVPQLLRLLGQKRIMMAGGMFAAIGLFIVATSPPWPVQAFAFALMGLGFYMLHNTFQAQVTEVAPHARASAVALHAFSFFGGQALGVVVMGVGLRGIGLTAATGVAAAVILVVGLTASVVLTRPAPLAKGSR